MIAIHKQRFAELSEQMESLLASKAPKYDSFLEKTKIEIEGNSLLEWKVNRLLKFTQPSTPAEQREKMTASPDEQ